MFKQKHESFNPNTKELLAEFDGYLKNTMCLLTGAARPLSSSSSHVSQRTSVNNSNILGELEEEPAYLAFVNENSDIQINNEKVIQTLMKVEKLPHINQ